MHINGEASDEDDGLYRTEAGHSGERANREREELLTFAMHSRVSRTHHHALSYQASPNRGLFDAINSRPAGRSHSIIEEEVDTNLNEYIQYRSGST